MQTFLSLAKNPWDHVPITQLHAVRDSLELLDLTSTNLTMIKNHEFHKMSKLKKLFLNSMENLEEIEPLAFHSLKNLEVIEVKNNPKLRYVDPHAFYDSLSDIDPNIVKIVDFSDNALRYISQKLLIWNSTQQVNFAGNPFDCDCSMSWMLFQEKIIGKEYLICSSPEKLTGKPMSSLKPTDFHCEGKCTK